MILFTDLDGTLLNEAIKILDDAAGDYKPLGG